MKSALETCDVVLVSMPWTIIKAPSIQLGILKAVLDEHGIATANAHLYLDFFNAVAAKLQGRRMSVDKFENFGEMLGEWAFSVAPFREKILDDEAAVSELARLGYRRDWIELALRLRRFVPIFLEKCVAEILAQEPRIVGFSTTFQQTVPSLVLSKMLKRARPGLRVVFGGANCEGDMGRTLHERFPWIDVVVRGEGERVVPRLFRQLLDGSDIERASGLCFRQRNDTTVCEDTVIDDRKKKPVVISLAAPVRPGRTTEELGPNGPVPMDAIPAPVYDDYFERLEGSPLASQNEQIWLPYESARGCWWALKHVCTFCAANSQYLSFRSRQPRRVAEDVVRLSARHGSRSVWFVDNIMDERYLRELFPAMKSTPVPMFVETRAHVSKDSLRAMRDAGVIKVQLGIESLSTPILQLIEKGTTAIQNIPVIKWCAELGIRPFYNLIYGFPGESPEEYSRMADAMLSLTHLEAPNRPVRLRLDRFSPYHRDPERFGIEVGGPYPLRRLTYDLPLEDVERIEYFFTFRYKDGRNPDVYTAELMRNWEVWHSTWRQSFRRLSWHHTDEGLRIYDTRSFTGNVVFELDRAESAVYLACEAGTTPRKAWTALSSADQRRLSLEDVTGILTALVAQRLMFAERGRYVSLAVEGNEALRRLHEESAVLEVRTLEPLHALE